MPLEANLDGSTGSWVFDAEVTDHFDEMLERSIPDYRTMRQVVTDTGSAFVQPGSQIVDLGASRGEALRPFVDRFGGRNRYVGVEISEPMREAFRQTFATMPEGFVRVLDTDLRYDYPFVDASLTLAVLTLIFVPINYRNRIVADVYRHTRPGGAFILVEKTIGHYPTTDRLLVECYHDLKARNGYSREEIDNKARALEGVQVPITEAANIAMLRNAGFTEVEPIWRCLNFAGWIAIKG